MAQTSYGERRRVEIAMALVQAPKVLLLDEPFAGLSVDERRDVAALIAGIPRDVTIVMIEHDMDVALEFAERITVLHFGEVVVEGTRAEVVGASAHQGDLPWRHDALTLSEIDAYYGDSHVLHGVSLRLGEGRLLGLLGRNGAGKSTSMGVAVGLGAAAARDGVGVWRVGGRPLARGDRGAGRGAGAAGAARVPQPDGAREPGGGGAQASRRRPGALDFRTGVRDVSRLAERREQYAGYLSGGEQQMLAIGRALMSNPRVLLMDEPSEGLAPQIVAEVMATIRRLKQHGLSIVLVEQNAKLVFDVADDIVILNSGRVVVDATAEALQRDGVDLHQHLGVF